MKVSDIPGFYELSTAEKIQLVEDLWDSIADHASSIPVTPAQKAELDRRLAAFEADGDSGRPADEVIDDIQRTL